MGNHHAINGKIYGKLVKQHEELWEISDYAFLKYSGKTEESRNFDWAKFSLANCFSHYQYSYVLMACHHPRLKRMFTWRNNTSN